MRFGDKHIFDREWVLQPPQLTVLSLKLLEVTLRKARPMSYVFRPPLAPIGAMHVERWHFTRGPIKLVFSHPIPTRFPCDQCHTHPGLGTWCESRSEHFVFRLNDSFVSIHRQELGPGVGAVRPSGPAWNCSMAVRCPDIWHFCGISRQLVTDRHRMILL